MIMGGRRAHKREINGRCSFFLLFFFLPERHKETSLEESRVASVSGIKRGRRPHVVK
jgi:hypothetical protein